MSRILALLAAAACTSALSGLPALAQAPAKPAAPTPEMTLTRLDCGTPQAPTAINERFSDNFQYGDKTVQFVYSCYVIKHGDDYMLWDTGHSMTAPNVAPKVSVVDQ